jgi:hypothetical protein
MEKNTKILLGLGAFIAAYLILKPKKAAAQTDVVTKKLEIDSLERVPSSDDTPEMILGATRRTYKDKDGLIYKYTWSSAYPPRGKYTDTNGNQWDDNGNPIIGDNIPITTTKTKDCVVKTFNCITTTYKTIQIPIDANCDAPMRYGGYQPEPPPCAEPLDRDFKFILDETEISPADRTNWGTWGN